MSLTQETIDRFVGLSHGDLPAVQAMLGEHPELLNLKARWGETALQAAAHAGATEICTYLLAQGAPLDLYTAAVLGMADRVAAFLDADPSLVHAVGIHHIPLLFFPVVGGQRAVLELLVARGADVNQGENAHTALHAAALTGDTALAEWLLAHGAKVNARQYEGKTALALAQAGGHAAVADLLRRHGGTE